MVGGAGVRKYGVKHNFNIRLHIPQSRGGSSSLAPQGGRGVFRRTKGACSPFGNPNLADFQAKRISFNAKSRNLTKSFRAIYHGKPHQYDGSTDLLRLSRVKSDK
jgi:hypothetical protein